MQVESIAKSNISLTHPHLLEEWSAKNTLNPTDVSFGSGKKVLWECKLNHEWTASISNRARLGTGCPYCSGNLAYSGFNDLETINPSMAKRWSGRNKLNPNQVLPRAKNKYWWICDLGHEWDEAPHTFERRGDSCPVCQGSRVLKGVNDLATTNPDFISSWSNKNNYKITEVSAGSDKKIIWECELEHEWVARISSRVGVGTGCPYCSGRYALQGFNDLATVNPDIAAQWSSKNKVKPTEVTGKSAVKVFWDCPQGHSWLSKVESRTSKQSGCLICGGRQVLVGFNDFAFLEPELLKEWSDENTIKPTEITRMSNVKVKWVCPASGHIWITGVSHRTHSKTGCPDCSASKTEKAFVASFSKHSGFVFASANIPLVRDLYINKRAQVDGLCESLKIAIEYDGQWSHGHTTMHGKQGDGAHRALRDASTTEALLNAGYRVIRIREHDAKGRLPFVLVDPANLHTSELVNNLHQVTYKSNGKHKDDIDAIVKKVVTDKGEWFVNE